MTLSSSGVEIPTHSLLGWQELEDGEAFLRALNPATGEELEPWFHAATTEQVARAAELAAAAAPAYEVLSTARRLEFLQAVADGLEAEREAIEARFVLETGLPPGRAQQELDRTALQWRRYAEFGASEKFRALEQAGGEGGQPALRSQRVPLGPVLVFGAGNFPLAYGAAGGDVASALAAGCPVISFAHEGHPGTAGLVAAVIQQAAQGCGMPEGVYGLVYGDGPTLGQHLLRQPGIAAVGFTGSRAGGEALRKTAQERARPIPVFAEMSSVNPMVYGAEVLALGAPERAARLHASVTEQAGQFCTKPGLIFLPQGRAGDGFVSELVRHFEATPLAVMLNPRTARQFAAGVERLSQRPGVTLRAQGRAREQEEAEVWDGALGRAHLFEVNEPDFAADLKEQQSEVFGPATLLIRFEALAGLPALFDRLEGQLTASLHLGPVELAAAGELIAAAQRRAGRLIFNGVPTGVEVNLAMVHAGPYPATFTGQTSVGEHALERWTRRVAWQNPPVELIEDDLWD